MQTQTDALEYSQAVRIPTGAGKCRVVDVTVHELDSEDPEFEVYKGHLGVRRIMHLDVQPIEGVHNVRWNGDCENPRFRVDLYELPFTVKVMAWGG